MDEQAVLNQLRTQKIFTIDQLMSLLQCAVRTAHRRMEKWQVYTSINQNGRYYVLADIPKFNKDGLWTYRQTLFSKHGNLKQTILYFIRESDHGLTSDEITELIGLPSSRAFLSHIRNSPEIRREKHHGHYLYFAEDPKIYAKQKRQWEKIEADIQAQLSDEEAVLVLVHYINHPHLSSEDIAKRLSRKGYRIKAAGIRQLFEAHGLQKKTSVTKQSRV